MYQYAIRTVSVPMRTQAPLSACRPRTHGVSLPANLENSRYLRTIMDDIGTLGPVVCVAVVSAIVLCVVLSIISSVTITLQFPDPETRSAAADSRSPRRESAHAV